MPKPAAKPTEELTLDTSVEELAGVGPMYVRKLQRIEIETVRDLLRYFPRRHDDLRDVKTLAQLSKFGKLPVGETITLRAKILSVNARRSRYGKSLVTAQIGSDRGSIEAIWFNQPYLATDLKRGQEYLFAGKLKESYDRPSLQSPTYEPVKARGTDQTHTARLVPVYPEREGISSKWLRQKIRLALPVAAQFKDDLPAALRRAQKLPDVATAIRQIHFPDSPEQAERARYRFDFEEILIMQLLTQRLRASWRDRPAYKVPYDPAVTKRFVGKLPWPLTDDQRQALHEVLTDLAADVPMLRLLEGDVGSGKTVVAAAAAYQAIAAGFQAALMVPTEVLARQHLITLREWFELLGIEPVLLLGSQSAKEKRAAAERIKSGEAKLVIGTHALIQENIQWSNLALAVIDEQHRFGVEQRGKLRGKRAPHLLSMTATPIPRSLAMTAYGDQDLSLLRSAPAGRQPVVTKLIKPGDRDAAYTAVREQLAAGRQAFIIFPVMADSRSGLRAAEDEYERLAGTILAGFAVGLLHGRLKPAEKDDVMMQFVRHELEALVSTTVVEVGVDIPNATVMLIEEAQRFGLAQLHQLRGRVGRGEHQAYCYLLPGSATEDDNERLTAMTRRDSGFDLAELDLELRGPGDMLGTRQSGFDVSVAGLTNPELLKAARESAQALLEKDPELKKAPALKRRLAAAVLPA